MTGTTQSSPHCAGCGNYIDDEDVFCSNCGREAPRPADAPAAAIEGGFVGFDCETCGASMTFDSEAEGLLCAFCGSVSLKRQSHPTGRIKAQSYLPFAVHRPAAIQAFEAWIGRGFFRPAGIKAAARVVSMRAIYLPFWSFHARTHTYYTADSSRTPAFARASWCPVFGEMTGEYSNVLVPASGSLTPVELAAMEPFDFEQRQPYDREALRDYVVEDFGLSRRAARPRARAILTERERIAASGHVPGTSRNVHVNPLFGDMRSDPVLLPIWINAYRYQDITYRFIVNGQTGRITGSAPFSYAKLAALILGIVIILAVFAAVASKV